MCWAAKWLGEKEILFNSVHASTAEAMLVEIHELLNEADATVTYNGKKFDLPILNKEFAALDMAPASPCHHIDLYRVVKKNFKFQSNKLDYVCQEFGLGHKFEHKGIDLWKGCMRGDEKSWAQMEKYNKQDVRLLDKLYARLLPWIDNHPNEALYDTGHLARPTCPNCGSTHVQSRGMATTKTGTYKRYQCQCGKWLRGRMTQVPSDVRENVLVSI